MAICGVCAKESSSHCVVCKVARYCSLECQKSDWKTHKKVCIPPAMPKEELGGACLDCGGWGKDLLGEDKKCTHCRTK